MHDPSYKNTSNHQHPTSRHMLPQFESSRTTILPREAVTLSNNSSFSRIGNCSKTNNFGKNRDLPILGRAQGGSDGNINMENSAIDWTYRPADLQGVGDAFAVYVTGDSMEPKYKNQDLAYVHPAKAPRAGRYVLVETKEHTGFIKQFLRWDGNVLLLKQLNPEAEIRLPREDVLRVMLVIGSLDA